MIRFSKENGFFFNLSLEEQRRARMRPKRNDEIADEDDFGTSEVCLVRECSYLYETYESPNLESIGLLKKAKDLDHEQWLADFSKLVDTNIKEASPATTGMKQSSP